MRPVDFPANPRAATHDATCSDGAPCAAEFGDSIRAAARRASGAGGSADEESSGARSTPGTDKASTSPQAGAARAPTTSRHADAQPHADATVDPRDARPRTHTPGHERTSQRNVRRHADKPQPPEGVALQTLLAAAHPLLAGANDAAAAPTPSALTPHDVAASVTQTWLREPSAQDAAGADRGAQWTFTLGDPLTPLAALRISGDGVAGWGLQLTAGNGLPARDLAAYTERLRRRLRARGQAVDRLEVDDDSQR